MGAETAKGGAGQVEVKMLCLSDAQVGWKLSWPSFSLAKAHVKGPVSAGAGAGGGLAWEAMSAGGG